MATAQTTGDPASIGSPDTPPSHDEFPCDACGARLRFEPGAARLVCPYCGHDQEIPRISGAVIEEYDFFDARKHARTMQARELAGAGREWRCTGCGALAVSDRQADHCAFCDAPVVLAQDDDEIFVPESLLPFRIDQKTARTAFGRWLHSLWFAPNDLAKRAHEEAIDGVYLPYWTYDARCSSRYTGQRGDHYWVTETYRDSEGKTRTRQVRKTRWSSRSGTVPNEFDDVLICASRSLPDWLIRSLEPWDLHDLTPYNPAFLSGFVAERYGVDLEEGFTGAQERMTPEIRSTVCRHIGGDEQRIFSLSTTYHQVSFKHFLLPLWISSFRYREKVYRFVVNARTGEPAGERPWSGWKITAAALGVAAIVGGIVWAVVRFG